MERSAKLAMTTATSQEFVGMERGERELIVKYLRDLAAGIETGGATPYEIGRRKALYGVANEIKQGAHIPKDKP